jgi:hypothetical protein
MGHRLSHAIPKNALSRSFLANKRDDTKKLLFLTTMIRSYRCFILFTLLLDRSVAWGPMYESLKGGGEGFAVRHTMLQARTRKDDSSTTSSTTAEQTAEQQQTSDRRYRYSFTQSLDYRESRRNWDGDFIPRLFISRPLLVDFDVFGVVNPFDSTSPMVESTDDGDDEEDCLIPEKYKLVDPQDVANVLEYLGIQRAKPVVSALLVRPTRGP